MWVVFAVSQHLLPDSRLGKMSTPRPSPWLIHQIGEARGVSMMSGVGSPGGFIINPTVGVRSSFTGAEALNKRRAGCRVKSRAAQLLSRCLTRLLAPLHHLLKYLIVPPLSRRPWFVMSNVYPTTVATDRPGGRRRRWDFGISTRRIVRGFSHGRLWIPNDPCLSGIP